jgi:hypothetical protein
MMADIWGITPEATELRIKDLAVAGQGVHAFLDAGAARIVEANEGDPGFEGHIHDLADFFGLHLAEAARPGGKILGKGEHRPARPPFRAR